jgi:hypothetical protein
VFGERVAGHRHFAAGLLAIALALLVPVGDRIGLGAGAAVTAGLVMLFTRYSAYHLVWITDGNHMLQGLAFLGALLLLLDGLSRASWPRLAGSLAAIAAGLLVREDTLAAVPALVIVGALAGGRARRRPLVLYTCGLAAMAVALLAWRRLAVPAAQPLGLDFPGFLRAVGHAFTPVGVDSFDTASRLVTVGWWLILALTALASVTLPSTERRWVAAWTLSAVAACTPGLLLQRDDLLFFPSLFVALALATAWSAMWRRTRVRPAVVFAAAWAMVGGAWTGARLAENFHPLSARAIDWNTEFLYGRYAAATIPAERRAALAARLDLLGIREGEEPRQRVRTLILQAKEQGRRRPTGDGRVFFPLLPERYF